MVCPVVTPGGKWERTPSGHQRLSDHDTVLTGALYPWPASARTPGQMCFTELVEPCLVQETQDNVTNVYVCMLSCSVLSDSLQPQAPLSMKFFMQQYWSGLPCPPLGDLPDPGTTHGSLVYPALAGGFFRALTLEGFFVCSSFVFCLF